MNPLSSVSDITYPGSRAMCRSVVLSPPNHDLKTSLPLRLGNRTFKVPSLAYATFWEGCNAARVPRLPKLTLRGRAAPDQVYKKYDASSKQKQVNESTTNFRDKSDQP